VYSFKGKEKNLEEEEEEKGFFFFFLLLLQPSRHTTFTCVKIPPSPNSSSSTNLSDSISPSTILSYLFPFFLPILQGGTLLSEIIIKIKHKP
jgi:hypothetical protein